MNFQLLPSVFVAFLLVNAGFSTKFSILKDLKKTLHKVLEEGKEISGNDIETELKEKNIKKNSNHENWGKEFPNTNGKAEKLKTDVSKRKHENNEEKKTTGEQTLVEKQTTHTDAEIKRHVRQAFRRAREILAEDDARKEYYFERGGNIISFNTPIQTVGHSYEYTILEDYGHSTGVITSFVFEVRACNDAHVGLKVDASGLGDMYEIVIGGWANTQSVIRAGAQEWNRVTVQHGHILDCNEYRTFMVSWENHNIQVLRVTDNGWESLISWQDTSFYKKDINYIGLTTARWASGSWRVVRQGPYNTFYTPRQTTPDYSYHLPDCIHRPIQRPFVIFHVQACNDAHVGLFPDYDTDGEVIYEIVIGGWANSHSTIRTSKQGASEVYVPSFRIMNCAYYMTYMVSWINGHIQVAYKGYNGWSLLMSWDDPSDNWKDVKYVGFTTGKWANGLWAIRNEYETGIDTPPGDSSAAAIAALNDMEVNLSEIEEEEREAVIALTATKLLLDRQIFNSFDDLESNTAVQEAFAEENSHCVNGEIPPIDCSGEQSSEFRTITGRCNNVQHGEWGSVDTPQARLVPAAYQDGFNAIREFGVNNDQLPSARKLSVDVFEANDDTTTPVDQYRTVMVMVMGQFLDHDVGETPIQKGYQSSAIACCPITDLLFRSQRPQCATISIDPSTDPFFQDTDCMNFVRSVPARGDQCAPGVREQLNAITAFVDGSQIYGSTDELAHSLREFSGGRMLVEDRDLLPYNDDSTCLLDSEAVRCFTAGDVRVNENPLLATMHTVFVRYHNHLADKFTAVGRTDDEWIYQTVRKIVGASLQNIVYGVWLPSTIGDTFMQEYGLSLDLPYAYDDTLDPSIFNGFAGAAFRYGHTLVRPDVGHVGPDFTTTTDTTPLHELFFHPDMLFDNITSLSRWMVTENCMQSDSFFATSLENRLFENLNNPGLDLGALNIQRGRDHGLPGYLKYVEYCGYPVATTFSELTNHSLHSQTKLSNAYSDARDIDLFVGAMAEENVPGGNLGPTFSCLLAEQFRVLKYGDRFWFQQPLPTGFTDDQQNNIRDLTLSKIFCEVLDLPRIPGNVFLKSSPFEMCSSLTDIDVTLWP